MATSFRLVPGPLLLTGAVLAGAVLSGCGGYEVPAAGPTATPATSVPAPVTPPSVKAPGVRRGVADAIADDPDGTGDRALPEGFPVQEVPLVNGTLVGGSKGKPGSAYAFTVILQVPGATPAAVMADVAGLLTPRGFVASASPSTPRTSSSTFTGPSYEVGVNVVRAGRVTTVSYVVVRR